MKQLNVKKLVLLNLPYLLLGLFATNLGEAWRLAVGAVSYTHLDVYKRQVRQNASAGRAKAGQGRQADEGQKRQGHL